jgi:hypothetical protein
MPEGLENGLTDVEFVDLVAFLAEQKSATPGKAGGLK